MALSHLADTSVLSRLNNPAVREAITELAHTRALGRCPMVDLELGFSARNAQEWDNLQRAVAVFPTITIEHADYVRAGGVQRALAAQGLKGRKVPDLLIAAAAERNDLVVLHYDRDFDLVAGVTGQRAEWVVPQGTVD